MDNESLYYIENRPNNGSPRVWWYKGGCGYTVSLDQAWKVNKKKADEIHSCRPHEDFPMLCEEIDGTAIRVSWRY